MAFQCYMISSSFIFSLRYIISFHPFHLVNDLYLNYLLLSSISCYFLFLSRFLISRISLLLHCYIQHINLSPTISSLQSAWYYVHELAPLLLCISFCMLIINPLCLFIFSYENIGRPVLIRKRRTGQRRVGRWTVLITTSPASSSRLHQRIRV